MFVLMIVKKRSCPYWFAQSKYTFTQWIIV